MSALPDIKLIDCQSCGKFIRDDAAYCWSCFNGPPVIRNCFAPFSRIRFAIAADHTAYERSLARVAFTILGVTDAPWADLLEPKLQIVNRGMSSSDVEEAIAEWRRDNPDVKLTPYRHAGWLNSVVINCDPSADQLGALLDQIFLLEKQSTGPAAQSLQEEEKFLKDILVSIEEFCRSHELGAREQLNVFNGRKRFAKKLKDLLAAARKPHDTLVNEWAGWDQNAHLLACRKPVEDSSGARCHWPGPDPDNPSNWMYLGFTNLRDRNHSSALIWFLRKNALDTKMQNDTDATVLGFIGNSLIEMNNFSDAETFFLDSLKWWSETRDRQNAQLNEASAQGIPLISQAPPDYLPHIRLAVCYSRMNKVDAAESSFKKALQLLDGGTNDKDIFSTEPELVGIFDDRRKSVFIFTLREYARFLEEQNRLSDAAFIRKKLQSLGDTGKEEIAIP